jgi:hypothetical protein
MNHLPQKKLNPMKFTEKLAAFRTLANCHGPCGMKKRFSTKPAWGEPPPCAALNYLDARHHGCCQLQPGGSEPPRQI